MDEGDEHTFLCGYQRTRGYGSLSNPQASTKTYQTIIRHQVKPTDTLQGLVLKYNTSMSEIKRLNRLWSNESLYLKHSIDIPIYEDVELRSASNPSLNADRSGDESVKQDSGETVQDIFKRIDTNIRKTTNTVHKLTINSAADLLSQGFELEPSRSRPATVKTHCQRSLNHTSSGYQNEAYQN